MVNGLGAQTLTLNNLRKGQLGVTLTMACLIETKLVLRRYFYGRHELSGAAKIRLSESGRSSRVCNLYSVYTTQAMIRKAFDIARDSAGNVPPLPGIFPDQMAPVVRMRWRARAAADALGLPASAEGRHSSGHQRPERRLAFLARLAEAAIPLPRAADHLQRVQGHQAPQDADLVRSVEGATVGGLRRHLAAVDGVRGTKADPVEGEHLLYSFLTSEPNGVVGPIHPKAMPVILTTPEEYETWLMAPAEEALKLQRPLPDDMLEIVAEGQGRTSLRRLKASSGLALAPLWTTGKNPKSYWHSHHKRECSLFVPIESDRACHRPRD